MTAVTIVNSEGANIAAPVTLEAAQRANSLGYRHVLDMYNAEIHTGVGQPTASQQILAQAGFGHKTALANIVEGQFLAGAVTNDGAIAGRLALQAYLMDATEDKLRANDYGIVGIFNRKAATTISVPGTKMDMPQFNYSRPEAGKARPIAQLSEPASMLSITVSDKSYKIAATSIGMEISDEAARQLNVDLVAIAMTRQAEEAAVAYAETAYLGMVNGDTDVGHAALSSVTAKSFDATIVAAGTLTQKAWVNWLFANSRSRRIDTVITDLAGALAIEARAGRPVVTGDNATSKRIDTLESVINPTWPDRVDVIISQDPNWPANTVVGFDSRYGYLVATSSALSYNAVEQYAMRRSTKVRVDTGMLAFRLYDQAWSVMTLTV